MSDRSATDPPGGHAPRPGSHVRRALALVVSLNFMWGLAYGLLDVLNRHFQDVLHVSQAQSGFLQTAFFGGYFTMALPASAVTRRFGYKAGILFGLGLYAAGALLFIPASFLFSFGVFLLALYILASGLACLETSSHPYVIVLGRPENAPARLTFAQAFNGVGTFFGPLIGGLVFFGTHPVGGGQQPLDRVRLTYVAIAGIVGVIAVLIARTPMPDIASPGTRDEDLGAIRPLHRRPRYVLGVLSLFLGLAGQVGVASFFINFSIEQSSRLTSRDAALLLSLGMILFTLGRFTSPLLMRRAAPGRLLSLYCAGVLALLAVGTLGLGMVSVLAVVASFFFMSILFPTLFALSLDGLGALAKRGSAFLVMAVCGCGILPVLMGRVADARGDAAALVLPAVCYLLPLWYGEWGSRRRRGTASPTGIIASLPGTDLPHHPT